MSDIFVFHHAVCWWKVGGELGKLRQEVRWDLDAQRPRRLCAFFSLASLCLLFEWQYAQFGPLYLCFTQTYTQTALPPTRRRRHTHIQMRTSLLSLPPLKALGAACLPFTVTALCACVCVCVDLRKEILRVKCSPGLNYHFWVLSHHPTSQGLAVFLSVSLSIIHTHSLSLSYSLPHSLTHRHKQEELQTVLAQWGVQ